MVLDGRPLQWTEWSSLGPARSLRTLTASLEQAGGLQRMTLRGHTGGVQKVLLTPGGIDIITSEPLVSVVDEFCPVGGREGEASGG